MIIPEKQTKYRMLCHNRRRAFQTRVLSLSLLLGTALLFSCASGGQKGGDGSFSNVNAEEAKAMIEANAGNDQFVILDTRSSTEYATGHLIQSEFYNYSAADYWEQIKKLDKTKTYLLYCHSGGRSGKTLKFMKENGFKEAHNLKGGIVSWKRAGYPVVTD